MSHCRPSNVVNSHCDKRKTENDELLLMKRERVDQSLMTTIVTFPFFHKKRNRMQSENEKKKNYRHDDHASMLLG